MKISVRRRIDHSWQSKLFTIVFSFFALFLLLSLVFVVLGKNSITALWTLVSVGFSNSYNFSEVLVKAAPLILTSLAVAVGLKMQLWNIGAQGQLYLGAIGTVWAARTFSAFPAGVLIPIIFISACVFGGLWGGIVGFLKKSLNVNEILTSLMLNYVATSLISHLVYGPWQDKQAFGFPRTAYLPDAAKFPQFFGTRVHAGLFIAIAIAVIVWIMIQKTSWGYEIRASGLSQSGAEYAGINIGRNTLIVFFICGALAGLAGMGEVSGLYHRIQQSNLEAGYGNYGIIIAWLAGANPMVIMLAVFMFSVVLVGADQLQVTMGISTDMVQIIIALIMCGVLLARFFNENEIVIQRRPIKESKHA